MSLPEWLHSGSFILIQSLNGLTLAMSLFLIASGLSLIFGVVGVLNFAHGSLYLMGAYLTYTIAQQFVDTPELFWVAIIGASLAVACMGAVIERVFLRRLYNREVLYQLLFTYAFVLIFSDAVKILWGPEYKSVYRPAMLAGSVSIMGRNFPSYYILVLIMGPVVALAFWTILHKTKWGCIIRAAASDREMVSSLGVNVISLFTVVFFLGSLLGGLGGALWAPVGALTPGMDVEIIVESFIVVVIGGLGSLWGTLLAAIIIGEVTSFGILVLPRFAMVFIYILMAIVLISRPWGLLGKPSA